MKSSILENTEKILNDLTPKLGHDYKLIKDDGKNQKDEYDQINKQLISLRKETQTIQQQIYACNSKINEMEKSYFGTNLKQTTNNL